ncbi:Holliday junction branch migration protein RuvA [Alginatibacterium sediminis]|uniref:Holliday junction branch migration complex subunit RuvA n=1 Tax=Alginatibacterium sediminis TaxID=2164068 RepID=A0A420EG90_9ALTE|nr:Holliday junction branch migration protein RuvA [Alginatibacterium sediminis]RKF19683.1 Holliday junction branch migration protein RuvA [Alginatibacterium sediminis]
MISKIRGLLDEKNPPFIVIDVAGIGYEIQMPMSCFYELPQAGEAVSVLTHFVVREDAQLLYGFTDQSSRKLFRELIKVNGIGPKVALAILSGLNSSEFVLAVQQDSLTSLTKIPGVGKKTAERLLVEMKDKLKDWQVSGDQASNLKLMQANGEMGGALAKPEDEALAALEALGYKAAMAQRVLKQVQRDGMTSEQLIRESLKAML